MVDALGKGGKIKLPKNEEKEEDSQLLSIASESDCFENNNPNTNKNKPYSSNDTFNTFENSI